MTQNVSKRFVHLTDKTAHMKHLCTTFFWNSSMQKRQWCKTLPCPPGYMHLNARPSCSACCLPAGVSSPPHFNIKSKVGGVANAWSKPEINLKYVRVKQNVLPSSELDGKFPFFGGVYLNWTFLLMPEKWPYLLILVH